MLIGNGSKYLCSVFLVLLFFSQTVYALSLTPEASAGLKYSNNALLQKSNEKDSWIYTGLAGISIEERTKLFSLAANTSIRSESYSNSDLNVDDKYYFNFGLSSRMDVIRRQLSFLLNNSFRQTLIDTSNPGIPDNIQNTNVLTFGSDIRIPLTPRQKLVFMPRYHDFYFETTDADNKQYSATLSWSYAVNPLLVFSIDGGTTKVLYKKNNFTDSDYVSDSLGVGVTRKQERSNINAQFGTTNIKHNAFDDQKGFTGSIRWSRELTDKSSFRLNIHSELRDSSQSLLGLPAGQVAGSGSSDLANEEITRDILRDNSFRMEYNGKKSVAGVNVWAALNNLDYKETLRDRQLKSLGFRLDYQLMKLVTSTLYGSYRYSNEIDLLRKERLRTFGVHVNYRLSHLLSCSFKAENVHNQSDVAIYEYAENSVYLDVTYGR
jgi:hypothetical protein